MWIFGYGSLVWRPSYPFLGVMDGWIEGWERRFWQGSPDHRGIPGSPGRVVTLIQSPGSVCWGRAYEIDDASAGETLAHLDHREKGGYRRLEVEIHFSDPHSGSDVGSIARVEDRGAIRVASKDAGRRESEVPSRADNPSVDLRSVVGLCYFADEQNEEYLGEATPEEIAGQVLRSRGPSGSNVEYVLELGEALRSMGALDSHVASIESLVRSGISRGDHLPSVPFGKFR